MITEPRVHPKKVLMLLGSRRCVPPTNASNTISWLLQSFVNYSRNTDVSIVSQWHDSLREIQYDREHYLHVTPAMAERLQHLVALLPYRVRKWLFGIADPKVIAYYLGQALIVRQNKPDLVIAHVAYPLFRVSHFLNPRLKHVYYFHSSNLADFPPPFIKDLYRNASGLISICQAALSQLEQAYGSLPMPSAVIHNGVNTNCFNPEIVAQHRILSRRAYNIGNDQLAILYVGRIHPTKGVDKIVDAFLKLCEQHPNLILLIAGDENNERDPDLVFAQGLRNFVRERGQDKVRFLGWIPYKDLPVVYAMADISVLASLEVEGNSMFLLESMACRLPVVSTAVGGVPEIVSHGETGLLVDPCQDITVGLVEALDQLINDRSLRHQMGQQAARRVLDQFSAEKMVDKLEDFLEANQLL